MVYAETECTLTTRDVTIINKDVEIVEEIIIKEDKKQRVNNDVNRMSELIANPETEALLKVVNDSLSEEIEFTNETVVTDEVT